jgi:hypothetical protein
MRFHDFLCVFLPVFTTEKTSSSLIPFTFGKGTLKRAALSFRFSLIAEDRAFAFFSELRSSKYCGKGILDGSAASLDLTFRFRWSAYPVVIHFRACATNLFVLPDLLLHLNLLLAPLLRIEFRSQPTQVLGILRCLVALSGRPLASSLFMVETVAKKLGMVKWYRLRWDPTVGHATWSISQCTLPEAYW